MAASRRCKRGPRKCVSSALAGSPRQTECCGCGVECASAASQGHRQRTGVQERIGRKWRGHLGAGLPASVSGEVWRGRGGHPAGARGGPGPTLAFLLVICVPAQAPSMPSVGPTFSASIATCLTSSRPTLKRTELPQQTPGLSQWARGGHAVRQGSLTCAHLQSESPFSSESCLNHGRHHLAHSS